MGWFSVFISMISAVILLRTNHMIVGIIAVITTIGSFWSWGIMHNYATNSAKRRKGYKGGFFDLTDQEIESVPDWITFTNMIFTIGGIILLIVTVIFIVSRSV